MSEFEPAREKIFHQIDSRRNQQIAKGFTLEDDKQKHPNQWGQDIDAYLRWGTLQGRLAINAQSLGETLNLDEYRKRLLDVAAMAVAAIEAADATMEEYDAFEKQLDDEEPM